MQLDVAGFVGTQLDSVFLCLTALLCVAVLYSSSQAASSYIIRTPQPHRSSQSQPVRGRDEEQDDIVSADVEEVRSTSQPNGPKIARPSVGVLLCPEGQA